MTAPYIRINGHKYLPCPNYGNPDYPTCLGRMDYLATTCRGCMDQSGAANHHYGHYKGDHLQTAYERKTRYYADHPEIKAAHTAVYRAVRDGLLHREPCAHCGDWPVDDEGNVLIEAHHWHGYDKAHRLDVQWLCRECHRAIERVEG